jgi:zinc protease
VKDGITREETEFIEQYLVRSHAFDVDTATKRLHQALDVELLGLPADYYSGYIDHVKAVTPDTANAAVKARIRPDDLLIVVVGTAEEIVDDIRAAIPRLAVHEIVPFDYE